jgi:multicomponent K+:H+ antiporter subunit E
MIARFMPYPLLFLGLVFMWLLLGGLTPGQFILAVIVTMIASQALRALGETSPPIRRWRAIVELGGIVIVDILRSNYAVAKLLLSGSRHERKSGFIKIPIRLRNPNGLAALAIVLTSTPGTAWLDYNSARGELLIHVFDLVDEHEWVETVGNRYERLLLEIFE